MFGLCGFGAEWLLGSVRACNRVAADRADVLLSILDSPTDSITRYFLHSIALDDLLGSVSIISSGIVLNLRAVLSDESFWYLYDSAEHPETDTKRGKSRYLYQPSRRIPSGLLLKQLLKKQMLVLMSPLLLGLA